MTVIGREQESLILNDILQSDRPEFTAVYGRRRVGKTYLVRQFFENKKAVFFNTTGTKNGAMPIQINHFTKEISRVFNKDLPLKAGKNWDETFDLLVRAMSDIPKNKKIILFFDEFPWMASRKSRLLETLDYFWNQYWSRDSRIKLIICGSSASWIIDKIINNKGGLHNRITRPAMLIQPFNLFSTKQLLKSQGVKLTNKQILQIYMVAGGVPYYLSNIQKGLSATQIINKLAFTHNSLLINEFNNLFSSLFVNHEVCEAIIRIISQYQYGISQEELFNKIDKNIKGKLGLTKLKELVDAGFIISFIPHFHKKRGIYYKVIDEYVLFYLKWIEPVQNTLLSQSLPTHYWEKQQATPSWHSWAGLAFESVCYKHISQIRSALNIPDDAIPATWRYQPTKDSKSDGAQIDLLFDRSDDVITVCEIKFTDTPFSIDKAYAKILDNKIDIFRKITHTEKQLFLSLISANGIKNNMYSEEKVDGVVTLEDLFK